MSVYIKGMEMPKGCAFCKISRRNRKKMVCPFCFWQGEWDIHDPMSADHRLDGCPLIPVPDHGDLIGRDALRAEVKKHATPSDAWVFSLIRTAPTIIPADKEESKT